MHIPVPGVGHHQDTGTVVNEINHSILQLKNVYIYISYLKGVFNLTDWNMEWKTDDRLPRLINTSSSNTCYIHAILS